MTVSSFLFVPLRYLTLQRQLRKIAVMESSRALKYNRLYRKSNSLRCQYFLHCMVCPENKYLSVKFQPLLNLLLFRYKN